MGSMHNKECQIEYVCAPIEASYITECAISPSPLSSTTLELYGRHELLIARICYSRKSSPIPKGDIGLNPLGTRPFHYHVRGFLGLRLNHLVDDDTLGAASVIHSY